MSMSALVVDDDEFVRRVLALQLQRAGVSNVKCAADGSEALPLLAGESLFDVVVLDLVMPTVDGVGLLRALGQMTAPPPVILISSAAPRLLASALKLAEAYGLRTLGSLNKPVESAALHQMLVKLADCRPNARPVARPAVTAEELRIALRRQEIDIAVQPKVAPDGVVKSVEVLARWTRPSGECIPPVAFIPLAEQSGMIGELTDLVLARALTARQRWRWDNIDMPVAINLPVQMLDDLELPGRLEKLVHAHGANPWDITLEVTETEDSGDAATSLDVLMQLRLRGFPISLDDFGTGYSSCSRLQNGPFTELKIDRSFVAAMVEDPESRSIVTSHVRLAHDLGLTVVAEGVEGELQASELSLLGCDLLQGYHIARPMPPERLVAWIQSRLAPGKTAASHGVFDLMDFIGRREMREPKAA